MPNISDLLTTNTANIATNTAAVAEAGGTYELITRTNITSNAANVVFSNISASSGVLKVIINNLKFTSDCNLNLNFKDSSGNDLTGSNGYVQANHWILLNSGHSADRQQFTRVVLNQNNQINDDGYTKAMYHAIIHFFRWGSTYTALFGTEFYNHDTGVSNFSKQDFGAYYTYNSTVPAGIQFEPSGGSVSSGTISLYKLV